MTIAHMTDSHRPDNDTVTLNRPEAEKVEGAPNKRVGRPPRSAATSSSKKPRVEAVKAVKATGSRPTKRVKDVPVPVQPVRAMAEEPDLWSLPTPAAASPAVVKTIDAEMKAALELNSQFSDQRRVAREPIIELPKPALPVVGESKQPIAEKSPEPFSAAAKATKETRPVIKGPLGSEWVQSIETDNPLLTAANAAISSVDTGKERRLFYLFLLVVAGLSVSLLYFTRRSEPAIAPAVTTEAPIIAPVESAPPVVEEPSANVEQPVTVIYGEEEVPAPLPPLPETPAARSEVTPVAPESPATDDRALYNLITRQ